MFLPFITKKSYYSSFKTIDIECKPKNTKKMASC